MADRNTAVNGALALHLYEQLSEYKGDCVNRKPDKRGIDIGPVVTVVAVHHEIYNYGNGAEDT